MKFLGPFVILLLVSTFGARAIGENNTSAAELGSFVTLKQGDGAEFRTFVAGPEDAKAGVLVVHDYFGISDATQQSVKHLGSLGYRSVAVDLYGGKSATSHEEAVKLMQSLDRKATDKILQAGLDYLKRPGRKLATIGFSMGAQESLNANLNDPEAVSATVMIYGFGFDKIDTKRLERQNDRARCSFIRVRTTVMRNHFSMKERITTPRPSAPHGCSWKIFLAAHYREACSLSSPKSLAEIIHKVKHQGA